MPVEIGLADSALADLTEIRDWYAREGVPEVGLRLIRRIMERVERLADYPDMGRIVPEFGRPSIRELTHPPFRIVYRRDRGAVRIIRVWRGERLLRLPDDAGQAGKEGEEEGVN